MVSRAEQLGRLLQSWDDQQAAYINHREQRFAIMLEVIGRYLAASAEADEDGSGVTVLDLGCGPGSLGGRVLDRFAGIRVIGLDYDPLLLAIASEWLGDRHGERFTAVDADLASDGWQRSLSERPVQLAVSSTALHWLQPAELVAVYTTLGRLLPANGIFLNADHLRYSPRTQPCLVAAADADDQRTQQLAHGQGVLTWDQWLEQPMIIDWFGPQRTLREQRFADRLPPPHAPLDLHLQALITAGFAETGTLWRHYDDVVLLARR
ncbi:class I SAM-dependent methyltransferase [Microlunatus sp. GCM10028923]|uniref:class I SAM-dependent methyltransferase n=1 Tax=Microlunatus sp. GCM10028923 TaxID=3273400 RepID=UPI00360D2D61